MLDLVVRIDDQAADTVPHYRSAGFIEDRVDCRRLVIEPDQVEMVGGPFHRLLQLGFAHARPRTMPERHPEMLLDQLGDMLGRRILETAHREAPAVAVR